MAHSCQAAPQHFVPDHARRQRAHSQERAELGAVVHAHRLHARVPKVVHGWRGGGIALCAPMAIFMAPQVAPHPLHATVFICTAAQIWLQNLMGC